MELVVLVEKDAVVAGTNPVPIGVDQTVVECQEPQEFVDSDERLKCRWQFVGRSLVEYPTQLDQLRQRLLATRFLLVGILVVGRVVL
jgi:hypothetical protein